MENYFYERLDDLFDRREICTGRRLKRFLQRQNFSVNGKRVYTRGERIAVYHDQLTLDGVPFYLPPDLNLVMNKVKGCLCTTKAGEYKTVYDYIPQEYFRKIMLNKLPTLHTVGRLDGDTEGLLILTTNGDLSHNLAVPENEVSKKYFVQLRDCVDDKMKSIYIEKCSQGIELPPLWNSQGFKTSPSTLLFINDNQCELTVTEGKYHEVKRIFAALDNQVIYLKRIEMGNFCLPPDLSPGMCREMTEKEILLLLKKN